MTSRSYKAAQSKPIEWQLSDELERLQGMGMGEGGGGRGGELAPSVMSVSDGGRTYSPDRVVWELLYFIKSKV